jgi:hypothetical protein
VILTVCEDLHHHHRSHQCGPLLPPGRLLTLRCRLCSAILRTLYPHIHEFKLTEVVNHHHRHHHHHYYHQRRRATSFPGKSYKSTEGYPDAYILSVPTMMPPPRHTIRRGPGPSLFRKNLTRTQLASLLLLRDSPPPIDKALVVLIKVRASPSCGVLKLKALGTSRPKPNGMR